MIRNGDCLKVLKTLKDNSVDSLVTDPPAGISFMGKDWDCDKGGREHWIAWMRDVMRESLRVLKPGAHALVWAIPRTSHWTATALEDAGFEIRDVVTHHFGSGFPKSMDISKAIDKAAGASREVIGKKPNQNSRGRHVMADGWKRPWNDKPEAVERSMMQTAPATDLAKQWQGWGTALKPASEHWILARKPISEKTVARNVEKWGTGGLNIDGCRIAGKPRTTHKDGNFPGSQGGKVAYSKYGEGHANDVPSGRFPANLILSHSPECVEVASRDVIACTPDCPVRQMDAQTKDTRAGKPARSGRCQKDRSPFENANAGGLVDCVSYEDSGGASRFFYVAKPSKREKGAGNVHPTVKPIKLMRYLIRMITPKGGLVLDPFTGSGTTGVAAIEEGCRFLGIEKEKEYQKLAHARIQGAKRKRVSSKALAVTA